MALLAEKGARARATAARALSCAARSLTPRRSLLCRTRAQAPSVYYLSGSRIKPMLEAKVGTLAPKLFTLADLNAVEVAACLMRLQRRAHGVRRVITARVGQE